MKFIATRLPEVILVAPDVYADSRGYLMESWHARRFEEHGISGPFVQENVSCSGEGALRGLHYQIKHTQGKLLRVVTGEVFDVAVDIRRSSPQFGSWVGEILSGENKRQLWVPPGFAHGFLVLSHSAIVEYKCTDYYAPDFERSIRWDDSDLNIDWPLAAGQRPIVSEKDAGAPSLKNAETFP